jgi:hypothetical protein
MKPNADEMRSQPGVGLQLRRELSHRSSRKKNQPEVRRATPHRTSRKKNSLNSGEQRLTGVQTADCRPSAGASAHLG